MLSQGQLSSSVGSIYTVPASTTAQVKTIIFFNGGVAARTVSVHLVPNSGGSIGTAGATNQVLNFDLPSGDTFEFSPSYPITYSAQNDSIQASASVGNEVNYYVMGVAS